MFLSGYFTKSAAKLLFFCDICKIFCNFSYYLYLHMSFFFCTFAAAKDFDMQKRYVLLISSLCFVIRIYAQQEMDSNYLSYIERYKDIVLEQEATYNIPAAITMAQALLESSAGKSELATEANNHFGIKCTSDWQWETYSHDDDAQAECFRKYYAAEDSFIDHSLFLKNRKRYASLFSLSKKDYKGWAQGLRQCGYATDPNYPQKIIRLIERYELQKLR